jgi:hypothetical protein
MISGATIPTARRAGGIMHARRVPRAIAGVVGVTALVSGGALTSASAAPGHPSGGAGRAHVGHVLLISVDGLHQQDLAWYVRNFPRSAMASLDGGGVEYSNAQTPVPAIIISAKHGQSPTDPNDLARVPDGPVIDGLNAAWGAAHPGAGDLVVFATDDDVMQLWLSDRSQAAADFAKNYLLTHTAAGNDIDGNQVTIRSSGLRTVYAGAASAAFFGVRGGDPRHPDVFGLVQHGVVYTGGKGKIAEHGGADRQDRNVPILVVAPGLRHGRAIGAPAETTQIAPTILELLGLNPSDLQAVRIEHTSVLPGLRGTAAH